MLYLRLRHAVGRRTAPGSSSSAPRATGLSLVRHRRRCSTARASSPRSSTPRCRRRARPAMSPAWRRRARPRPLAGRDAGGDLSAWWSVGANLAESAGHRRRRRAPRCAAPCPAPGSCPRCAGRNVRGALEAGLAPACCPGGVPLADGAARGRGAGAPCPTHRRPGRRRASSTPRPTGRIEVLVLLGADPLADVPDRSLARRALAGARTVISLDRFLNASRRRPHSRAAASPASPRCDGTTTNLEGRVSALRQKVTPPGTARADWMIAAELAARLGADLGVDASARRAAGASSSRTRRRTPRCAAVDLGSRRGTPTACCSTCDRRRRSCLRSPASTCRRPTPTRCVWWSTASCTTRGSLLSHCAVLGRAWLPRPPSWLSPADAAPLGVADRHPGHGDRRRTGRSPLPAGGRRRGAAGAARCCTTTSTGADPGALRRRRRRRVRRAGGGRPDGSRCSPATSAWPRSSSCCSRSSSPSPRCWSA